MSEHLNNPAMEPRMDERAPLCGMLEQFAATHPGQRETALKILDFVRSHADCFHRSCVPGHITGSAWLLNPAGDKALLTQHRNLKRWLQPGGHADGDADVLRVALREATEESGIDGIRPLDTRIMDVDIHEIPARPAKGEPAHLHLDIRFMMQAPHEQYTISDESDDLAWWSYGEIRARRSELDAAVLRMADIWMRPTPN